MAVLEEKISILKEADMTLDHIVIMNEVADNLEAVQKSMGTVESIKPQSIILWIWMKL